MGSEPLTNCWGRDAVVTSEELTSADSGFVANDSVEIRVDISVTDVCVASFNVFEVPGALAADIKFKVADSVFYVNKGYMSVVSSVFRDLFALTEAADGKKETEELELKDLDASEFNEFLGVIYPTCYPISDTNVYFDFEAIKENDDLDQLGVRVVQALIEKHVGIHHD